MEFRTFDLTIISADDLKKVSFCSRMHVYVRVSILDSTYHHLPTRSHTQKTPVDKHGNTRPIWNFPMNFTLNEIALQNNRLTLVFRIMSHRKLLPDSIVGEVHVPVADLQVSEGKASSSHASFQVRKKSGKPKGLLNLSYKYGDKFVSSAAFGATNAGYAYPPEHGYLPPAAPGVGYAYPTQGYGHGYRYGYGYPPPAQQPVQTRERRNGFGMGMGGGMLGGALAGLVMGDIVSDMAYDGGYDNGGYDDGGFDFF